MPSSAALAAIRRARISDHYTGDVAPGFVAYVAFAAIVRGCLLLGQRKRVGASTGPRGKALDIAMPARPPIAAGAEMAMA